MAYICSTVSIKITSMIKYLNRPSNMPKKLISKEKYTNIIINENE
ncbi:hypothetical protein HNQ88_004996 [Aureibacter tunicatorum]|uniref:Uncharacterized protein n=1 Tax=Aureibacter tunicatorum TaxID=866807 RepID=A0AAE3XUG1_9BACT|nr:hypothetical protein [Aureibacter tunicatorum]BDD07458.1 hypothetical protein AUTU_49410 [Aureibacter tunicatorum]